MKSPLMLLVVAALLGGCTAMENARQSVERTGNKVGQSIEKADDKVTAPVRRSGTQQKIDNVGAKIDNAVNSTLKR